MRLILTLFATVMTLLCVGCVDRPELSSPKAYGTVLKELPHLEEAAGPFQFPFAGDTDHSKCEFNEEDFF